MRRFLPFLGLLFLLVSCQVHAQVSHHRPSKHTVHKHVVKHRVASVHHEKDLPPIPWEYTVPTLTTPGLTLASTHVDAASVRCLSETILLEARGEPVRGQIAVANVVMNRTTLPQYASTVCGVVHQSVRIKGKRACQFSWVCHPMRVAIKPEVRRHAEHLAKLALQGRLPNIAGNRTSFHATHVRVRSCGQPMTIGHHVFCTSTSYYASAKETHDHEPVSGSAVPVRQAL